MPDHPHAALDLRIRCQAMVRSQRDARCTAWARYRIVADAFQGETMVCGTHARSWIPAARKPLAALAALGVEVGHPLHACGSDDWRRPEDHEHDADCPHPEADALGVEVGQPASTQRSEQGE